MVKKIVSAVAVLALCACGGPAGAGVRMPLVAHHDDHATLDLKAADRLDDAAPVAVIPRIAPTAGRQGEWLLVGNHLHTKFSVTDGKQTLAELIARVKDKGLDGMILTDHNSMRGAETEEFKSAPVVMVKGMEFGAWREKGETVVGHAALIGLEGNDPLPTYASLEQMLALAKGRKAYVIANHPFNKGNAWLNPTLQPEVDAVEIWNGWWALVNPIMPNNDAKTWWDAHLAKGRRVTAVGGSDSHGQVYDDPSRGSNLIFARDRSPEAVLEGLKKGHVSIVAHSRSPRMILEADPARDGSWTFIQGDEVAVSQAGPVPMRVRVVGAKGLTVELFGKAGRLGAIKVDSQDAVVKFDAVGVPGVADYVRAELKKHPGKWWSLSALTNPIYLK
ncbi:MAG: CehA/McbA family metallohydrolase [Candidatus Sericytochromatia bacterium]|nr:CehA/McbA family metallohydrolase [Candidatus Tanganyikabacteria bacterium]